MENDNYRGDEPPSSPNGSTGSIPDETTDPQDNSGEFRLSDSGPATAQVRISAVEAAVAAGLAPSTSREVGDPIDEEFDPHAIVELPEWTAPATGQVPRVLLDEGTEDTEGLVTRGPSWREDRADWDDDVDLSIFAADPLLDEPSDIAGQIPEPDGGAIDPFSFGDLGLGDVPKPGGSEVEDDDEAWHTVLGDPEESGDDSYGFGDFGPARRSDNTRRARHRRGAHRSKAGSSKEEATDDVAPTPTPRTESSRSAPAPVKRALVATATGVVAAGIAAACFWAGSITALVLATVVLVVAAGEFFGALRRVGFRPATIPGLLTVGGLVVGGYLRGGAGFPLVLGVGIVATSIWFLSGLIKERPAINLSATFGAMCWVGVLGAFAGLLLSPATHPHRHGIALLVAAIVITVAHDVGSYGIGARFGRHLLAPKVSPHKTVEGLIGGTIAALLIGSFAMSQMHPISVSFGFELAVLVSVFAPLGDLTESLIKRDLGIKDMGSLLPGHGGILDRIDAMLFVLPATYYLASLHHLG